MGWSGVGSSRVKSIRVEQPDQARPHHTTSDQKRPGRIGLQQTSFLASSCTFVSRRLPAVDDVDPFRGWLVVVNGRDGHDGRDRLGGLDEREAGEQLKGAGRWCESRP